MHFHRRIHGYARIRHGKRPGALRAEGRKPAERLWMRYWGWCRSTYNFTLWPSNHTENKFAQSSSEPSTTASTSACMHTLAPQLVELRRTHPHAPPPPGSGDLAALPDFARLKALLEEVSANGFRESSRHWAQTLSAKAAGATGGGKRRPAAGQAGHKVATGQARTGIGTGAGPSRPACWNGTRRPVFWNTHRALTPAPGPPTVCLLYTSDAADE